MSTPEGAPSALTIAAAAAALNFPHERTLRDWCRRGHVQAVRLGDGERWWIPAAELERLARLLQTRVDWAAAIDVDL